MTNKIVTQQKARKHRIIGTVIKVGKRTVGQVIDGVFVKDVSARKHFLRTPEAIAFTIDTLHAAQRAGAEYCEVLDTDTGTKYRASISKVWDMGKRFDYGYGSQIYLTLSNWLQTRDPQTESQTDAPEYSTSDITTHQTTEAAPSYFTSFDAQPLHYKSNAPVGIKVTKGKKTPKQIRMFGDRE